MSHTLRCIEVLRRSSNLNWHQLITFGTFQVHNHWNWTMNIGPYVMPSFKLNSSSLACWNSIWILCIRTNTCCNTSNRCKNGSVQPHGIQCPWPERLPPAYKISISVRPYSTTKHRMWPFAVCRLHSKRMAYRCHSPTILTNRWFGTISSARIWPRISIGKLCRKLSTYTIRRRKSKRIIEIIAIHTV